MDNLEKYIALAKSAKDFAKTDDGVICGLPNVTKTHINGLADMIIKLVCEVKNLSNQNGILQDYISLIQTHSSEKWVIDKANEELNGKS